MKYAFNYTAFKYTIKNPRTSQDNIILSFQFPIDMIRIRSIIFVYIRFRLYIVRDYDQIFYTFTYLITITLNRTQSPKVFNHYPDGQITDKI